MFALVLSFLYSLRLLSPLELFALVVSFLFFPIDSPLYSLTLRYFSLYVLWWVSPIFAGITVWEGVLSESFLLVAYNIYGCPSFGLSHGLSTCALKTFGIISQSFAVSMI